MKIHMHNGGIYNIPKGVRIANISIALNHIGLQLCQFDIKKLKLEMACRKNEKILRGFRYIGYEKICMKDISMEIECHWYIDWRDLIKCSYSYGDNDE